MEEERKAAVAFVKTSYAAMESQGKEAVANVEAFDAKYIDLEKKVHVGSQPCKKA